jgi:hypothetical protein
MRNNGSCPWYTLSQPRPENKWALERQEVVCPDIAVEPKFAFDDMEAFGGNTIYIMPVNDFFYSGF